MMGMMEPLDLIEEEEEEYMNGYDESEGMVSSDISDRASEGGKTQGDKQRALDYAKAKYDGSQEEKQKVKIMREPKKLDHKWGEGGPEAEQESEGKSIKKLPKEQDLVCHIGLGLDYSKTKYQEAIEKEQEALLQVRKAQGESRWGVGYNKDGSPIPIPANWTTIEKVAPPEITKNVRALFESGNLPDIRQPKKFTIEEIVKDVGTGGVYENEPEHREGVIRESDINMEGEVLSTGMARNLAAQYLNRSDAPVEKAPIVIDRNAGVILESEPAQRDDVCREADYVNELEGLQGTGTASSLRERFLEMQQEKPKERKVIKLVEDDNAVPIVCESTPLQREGVVRADEPTDEQIMLERGRTRNMAAAFSQGPQEYHRKDPIVIERDAGYCAENEPTVREGVSRETDGNTWQDTNVNVGHAKNLASAWLQVSDEVKQPKKEFKMELATDERSVLENEPTVRDDVVHGDTAFQQEEYVPGVAEGQARNLASRFQNWDHSPEKPRPKQIVIERAQQEYVLENEPQENPNVVKGGGPSGWEPNMSEGHTKGLLSKWKHVEEVGSDAEDEEAEQNRAGKPQWLIELEAAKEAAGAQQDDDDDRRLEEEEENTNIPIAMTKNLRNMWLNKEQDEEEARKKPNAPEVIRRRKEPEPPPSPEPEKPKLKSKTANKFGGKVSNFTSKFGGKAEVKKKEKTPPPPPPEPEIIMTPFGPKKVKAKAKPAAPPQPPKPEPKPKVKGKLKSNPWVQK